MTIPPTTAGQAAQSTVVARAEAGLRLMDPPLDADTAEWRSRDGPGGRP